MNPLLIPFVLALLFLGACVFYALRLEKKKEDAEVASKMRILDLTNERNDYRRLSEEKSLKVDQLNKEIEELKSSPDIDVTVDGGGADND